MTEEILLLRRYIEEKSETAFAELVRGRIDFVYACAVRRVGGDTHLAEDVVQRVFTVLAQNARMLAQRETLGGWLFTATKNVSGQVVRTERRRKAREAEAYVMNEVEGDATAEDWQRLRPLLDATLDGLREPEREAVLLRFVEGKSFAEVGTRLHLTENAAQMRVHRALAKMEGMLARRGVTSTSAALGVALASQSALSAPAGLAASVTGTALAGAATVAGVKGILIFMSTTKITACAVAALAVAVGTALHQANKAREALELQAAAVRDYDAQKTKVVATERALAALRTEADELKAKLASAVAQKSAAQIRPPQVPASEGSRPNARLDLNDPELRRLWQEHTRAGVRMLLGPFAHAKNLSVEQEEQLAALLEERASLKGDVTAAVKAALHSANPPAEAEANAMARRLMEQGATELDGKMAALLGEEGHREFERYFATSPEREVASRIIGQVYFTDAPVNGPQAEQLVQSLAQNKFRAGEPGPRGTVAGVSPTGQVVVEARTLARQQGIPWTDLISDAAVKRAENILTPSQLVVMRQFQAQQAALLKLTAANLRK
jgi:RNA polymerase sigma factor (sigma-70 family)